ncbi:MAG: oligosaccharide flippase family protein, partial [Syntrophales bacterium LBB04]|nr:oligosaccharide flippase family protein [Syntrophales bacterium LBB04]
MNDPNRNLIKRNLIANLTGNGWIALLSFGTIPVYIHFLGIESYGLIGISVLLLSLVAVLDMGLTVTLGREMARLSALPDRAQESRDLVRSLEILVWIIAVSIGILVIISADFISQRWVKPDKLSLKTIQNAVILMGMAIALQWPTSFYASGLAGLQNQVLLNAITATTATIRCGGAVVILWLISPTLQAFFVWQMFINMLQTVALAVFLWKKLPYVSGRSHFRKNLLKGIWR